MAAVEQRAACSRELHAGDVVTIRSAVRRVDDKAITAVHELLNDETGEVAAIMTVVGVHIDALARKARPLPSDVRARAALMSENGANRSRRRRDAGCAMNGFQHSGAFVVQFRAGSDFESGRIEGRVEHIASGESARFDSAAALLAIFARLIRERRGLDTRRVWTTDSETGRAVRVRARFRSARERRSDSAVSNPSLNRLSTSRIILRTRLCSRGVEARRAMLLTIRSSHAFDCCCRASVNASSKQAAASSGSAALLINSSPFVRYKLGLRKTLARLVAGRDGFVNDRERLVELSVLAERLREQAQPVRPPQFRAGGLAERQTAAHLLDPGSDVAALGHRRSRGR
jgi:hypothetical protein